MSEENEVDTCCASCGITEIDDTKLVPCDDCDLVRYCSDECRENHRSRHRGACKKRAAELRDELLFKQPEGSHMGDCPICSLPMPLDDRHFFLYKCCSKVICNSCSFVIAQREGEMRLDPKCPFCREAFLSREKEKLRMKRVQANDPAALCYEAEMQHRKGNHSTAFEYWGKAAKLGNVQAHRDLALLLMLGRGVEQDVWKGIHHLEEAAIGGHPDARYLLGRYESENGYHERATKHWVIAAAQGHDEAIKALMDMFRNGFFEKEDLASALRAHKAAVDATKSPQREAGEKIFSKWKKDGRL